jgi:hypothetical protein
VSIAVAAPGFEVVCDSAGDEPADGVVGLLGDLPQLFDVLHAKPRGDDLAVSCALDLSGTLLGVVAVQAERLVLICLQSIQGRRMSLSRRVP